PHLLAPGVRVDPVLLTIARGDRRLLGGRLGAERDAPLLGLAEHVAPALRELLEDDIRDVLELRRPLVDWTPCEAQAPSYDRSQMGLVEVARGLGRAIERRPV